MRNKIICIVCVIIFCISTQNACVTKKYSVSYYENTGVHVEKDDVTLISSMDELNEYKSLTRFQESSEEFKVKLESYSSEFFQEKMLIVVNIEEITGSSDISLKDINYTNSEANLVFKRKIPKIVDNSMKIWSFFVEIDVCEIEKANYTLE